MTLKKVVSPKIADMAKKPKTPKSKSRCDKPANKKLVQPVVVEKKIIHIKVNREELDDDEMTKEEFDGLLESLEDQIEKKFTKEGISNFVLLVTGNEVEINMIS